VVSSAAAATERIEEEEGPTAVASAGRDHVQIDAAERDASSAAAAGGSVDWARLAKSRAVWTPPAPTWQSQGKEDNADGYFHYTFKESAGARAGTHAADGNVSFTGGGVRGSSALNAGGGGDGDGGTKSVAPDLGHSATTVGAMGMGGVGAMDGIAGFGSGGGMMAALDAEQWSEAAETAKLAEEDTQWRRRLKELKPEPGPSTPNP
jgi:hypothetical protein